MPKQESNPKICQYKSD